MPRPRSFFFLLPVLLVMLSCQSSPPSAEEIVARCADAMSIDTRITDIRTLVCDVTYPDHGYPVHVEIERPSRIRTEGGDTYVIVFDGTHGAYLSGGPSGGGIEFVPDEQLKDFEVDIAFHYPAFFEYTPVFKGLEDTLGVRAYVLEVTLPAGGVMTYRLDPETYLIKEAVTRVDIGGKEFSWGRTFTEYQEAGGIRYFKTFEYKGREGVETATVEQVLVDPPLAEDRFDIP